MQASGDGVRLRCVLSYSLHTLKTTGHHLGSLVWKLVWRSWAHTQGFSGVPTFYRTMLEEAGRELCSILLLQGVPALHGSSSLHTCLPILASAADSCVSRDTLLSPEQWHWQWRPLCHLFSVCPMAAAWPSVTGAECDCDYSAFLSSDQWWTSYDVCMTPSTPSQN